MGKSMYLFTKVCMLVGYPNDSWAFCYSFYIGCTAT